MDRLGGSAAKARPRVLIKKDVSRRKWQPLTYAISGGNVAGDTVTITLKASCNNYEDFTITLTITLTEKDDQQALKLTGGTTVVYGETLQLGTSGGSGAGAVTYAITDVDGQGDHRCRWQADSCQGRHRKGKGHQGRG